MWGTAGPCGRGYVNVSSHSRESGSASAGVLQGPGCRLPSVTQASELPRRLLPAVITRPRASGTVPSVGCWGQGAALGGGEGHLQLSALDLEEPTLCQPLRGTGQVAPPGSQTWVHRASSSVGPAGPWDTCSSGAAPESAWAYSYLGVTPAAESRGSTWGHTHPKPS